MKKLLILFVIIVLLVAGFVIYSRTPYFSLLSDVITDFFNGKTSSEGYISGEDSELAEGYVQLSEPLIKKSEHYPFAAMNEGRNSLDTEEQKELYSLLTDSAFRISRSKTDGSYTTQPVSFDTDSVSKTQFHVVVNAFLNDNPQAFWCSRSFMYETGGNTSSIRLISYLSPNQCEEAIKELEEAYNGIIEKLPSDLSEFDRELFLHDTLLDNCEYEKNSEENSSWKLHTVYGALTQGKAVCDGYADSMQLLLAGAGIRATILTGSAEGELHAWNAANIDSEWYCLDPTWDDSGDETSRYLYFNLTSAKMAEDHTLSPLYTELSDEEFTGDGGEEQNSFNIKEYHCNATENSFINKKGMVINSFSDSSFSAQVESLLRAASDGAEYLYIVIDKNIGFDEAYDKLFNGGYWYYDICTEANSRLNGKRLKKDSFSVIDIKEKGLIIVYLEYE